MADESKLTIYPFEDAKFNTEVKNKSFSVMFNPSGYSRKFSISYDEQQGKGTGGSPKNVDKVQPGDITLEFTIDGTGTVAPIAVSEAKASEIAKSDIETVDVVKKIDEFHDVCYKLVGKTHRPYFLRVIWGNLSIDCVLLSADIKYTLFDKQGKPLRATISATFSEAKADEVRIREEGKNSPDLTHIRVVQEGDTLPLMTHRIYGDSSYYLQVAKANRLKDFRKLQAGQEIFFPPIDKNKGRA